MKRNVLYILMAFSLLTSCHDLDLNPLSNGSTETWYSTEKEIEMAVNDLYRIAFWTPDGGTVDWSDDYINRESLSAFENATLNGQDGTVKNLWAVQYKAIARANSVITKGPRAIDAGASKAKVDVLIGEAYFHRACAYSKLVSKFGDVPLVLDELEISEGLTMGRTDKATVLQKIYEDFDAAASVLPVTSTGVVRATKGAALAMKGRIALYMSDWKTAAVATKAVMDLNVYKLHPSYSDLFMQSTKSSDEFVFVIPRSLEYSGSFFGATQVRNDLVRNVGGWAATDPSWDLLAAYTCTDGLPVDESPLFDPHDPFKNRDPRCAMSIVPFGENFLGVEYTPHPEAKEVMNYTLNKKVKNNDARVNAQYASYNGLAWKKGIDITWTQNGFQVAPDMLVCRYADVLLMYAEAKIELNEVDQSVLDAMNKVRARAYGVEYTDVNSYPAFTPKSQVAMRKEIRMERRMEFPKENLRYMDLIRWKLSEVVMSKKVYGMVYPAAKCIQDVTSKGDWFWAFAPDIDENGLPDFSKLEAAGKIQAFAQRVWDNRQYLWPIPTTELQINPNMNQNTGY